MLEHQVGKADEARLRHHVGFEFLHDRWELQRVVSVGAAVMVTHPGIINWSCELTLFSERGSGGQPPVKSEV